MLKPIQCVNNSKKERHKVFRRCEFVKRKPAFVALLGLIILLILTLEYSYLTHCLSPRFAALLVWRTRTQALTQNDERPLPQPKGGCCCPSWRKLFLEAHFLKDNFPSVRKRGAGLERREAGCRRLPHGRQQLIWQVARVQPRERRQDSKFGSGNSSSPPRRLFSFAHEKTPSSYRRREPQAGRRWQSFPSLLHPSTVLSRVPLS